jgi:hypothetical protein
MVVGENLKASENGCALKGQSLSLSTNICLDEK